MRADEGAAANPRPPSGLVLRSRRDAVFFSAMALVILGTVLLGFARTYYFAEVFAAHLPNPLVHVHCSSRRRRWYPPGRLDLYRRFGVLGAALACAMVVLAFLDAADRSIPVFSTVMFCGLIVWALRTIDQRDPCRQCLDAPSMIALQGWTLDSDSA